MAGAVGRVVEGLGGLVQPVDVLHHVDLAGLRPAAAGPHRGAQGPERRRVTEAVGRVRLLDRRGHLELAARRGREVVPGALDPAGRPGAAVVDGLQDQVAVAVDVDVIGRVGGLLFLPGPVAGPDVVEPVVRRRRRGPAAPAKLSPNTVVQPDGGGGTVSARAAGAGTSPVPTTPARPLASRANAVRTARWPARLSPGQVRRGRDRAAAFVRCFICLPPACAPSLG